MYLANSSACIAGDIYLPYALEADG